MQTMEDIREQYEDSFVLSTSVFCDSVEFHIC